MAIKVTNIRNRAIALCDELVKLEGELRSNLRTQEATPKFHTRTLAQMHHVGIAKKALDTLVIK